MSDRKVMIHRTFLPRWARALDEQERLGNVGQGD
jgi:hypothetical protein